MTTQPTKKARINLDVISIKDPCTEDWGKMQGDDRVRFCGLCSMNVYNLSEMSRKEAEDLIANREGRLCVRYYMRQDGTVISKDCSRIRKMIRRSKAMVAGVCSMIVTTTLGIFGISAAQSQASGSNLSNAVPQQPAEPRIMGKVAIQGDVILPPAVMGGMPGPDFPPATQPSTQPTTKPTTQPTTKPVCVEVKGEMIVK